MRLAVDLSKIRGLSASDSKVVAITIATIMFIIILPLLTNSLHLPRSYLFYFFLSFCAFLSHMSFQRCHPVYLKQCRCCHVFCRLFRRRNAQAQPKAKKLQLQSRDFCLQSCSELGSPCCQGMQVLFIYLRLRQFVEHHDRLYSHTPVLPSCSSQVDLQCQIVRALQLS